MKNNRIPVFHIPVGCSRFRYKFNSDGTIDLIVLESDRQLSVGTHTKEEMWDDQIVAPLYVIRFDNLEHIKGYGEVFFNFVKIGFEKYKKEKENESRTSES